MTEKELKKRIKGIVAYQFDHVTNLTQEAYEDSLKMIAEQTLTLIKDAGFVELDEEKVSR